MTFVTERTLIFPYFERKFTARGFENVESKQALDAYEVCRFSLIGQHKRF